MNIKDMSLTKSLLIVGFFVGLLIFIVLLSIYPKTKSVVSKNNTYSPTKVPVVVSQDVGCNSEFIKDGENGILRDPFSEVGWAEPIIKLLQDKSYRQAVGEAGYRTCVEKFDIKNTIRKIQDLYLELARP